MKNTTWEKKNELRLILTHSCNFHCPFCHREGVHGKTRYEEHEILKIDDYVYLYQICSKYLGWDTVTLTGGEPLIREDIITLCKKLHMCGAKITVVTNGSLLKNRLEIGKYVYQLNISVLSVDKKISAKMTGVIDSLEEQLESIKLFRDMYPDVKIRINSVVTKSTFKKENVMNLMKYAESIMASMKFIEVYPVGSSEYLDIKQMEEILQEWNFIKQDCKDNINIYSNGNEEIALYRLKCSVACEKEDAERYCRANRDVFLTPHGKVNLCMKTNILKDIYYEIVGKKEEKLIKSIEDIMNYKIFECTEEKNERKTCN